MTRDELIILENKIMEETVQRRKLGGFDTNAETILKLTEWMLKLTGHVIDKEPQPVEKRKNK